MSRSIDLLKNRYLENIKENPELFIGIELEYPVANLEGIATDVEIIKDLFHYLVSALDFTVEKVDDFGNPIQLVDPTSQDAILFMDVIQRKLGKSNHAIVGCGIHPNWDKVDMLQKLIT